MRAPDPAKMPLTMAMASQITKRKTRVANGASMSDVPCLAAQP